MKGHPIWLALLVILIIFGCSKSKSTSMDPKEKSIQEFYQQWFGAMENADVDSFLSLFAEEYFSKGPNQPAVTDKQILREHLTQFHQSYMETVKWEIGEINLFENTAVIRLSEEVTLVSKENGDTTKIKGVHFELLSQQPDGNWKLKSDVSSLNHPPPSNS